MEMGTAIDDQTMCFSEESNQSRLRTACCFALHQSVMKRLLPRWANLLFSLSSLPYSLPSNQTLLSLTVGLQRLKFRFALIYFTAIYFGPNLALFVQITAGQTQ